VPRRPACVRLLSLPISTREEAARQRAAFFGFDQHCFIYATMFRPASDPAATRKTNKTNEAYPLTPVVISLILFSCSCGCVLVYSCADASSHFFLFRRSAVFSVTVLVAASCAKLHTARKPHLTCRRFSLRSPMHYKTSTLNRFNGRRCLRPRSLISSSPSVSYRYPKTCFRPGISMSVHGVVFHEITDNTTKTY
jgi:hypothetical protein